MRRQLFPALGMLLVFTVITGLMYPLLVTGIAQTAFADKADGSLVERDGVVVGSKWIGQPFVGPEYFHPRPSADGYVPGAQGGGTYSYGSNYGPLNDVLLYGADDEETADVDESASTGIDDLVRMYREENGLDDDAQVPVDAVTSSGSGLDPHISVANARLQAGRVADDRGLDVAQVLELIDDHTDGRAFGFLGEPGVNVLELNLALDDA
jgi:K+-transporting ATPase ATPase C chain